MPTPSPESFRYESVVRLLRSAVCASSRRTPWSYVATILPLAAERGIGVLVYAPFGRTRP